MPHLGDAYFTGSIPDEIEGHGPLANTVVGGALTAAAQVAVEMEWTEG